MKLSYSVTDSGIKCIHMDVGMLTIGTLFFDKMTCHRYPMTYQLVLIRKGQMCSSLWLAHGDVYGLLTKGKCGAQEETD